MQRRIGIRANLISRVCSVAFVGCAAFAMTSTPARAQFESEQEKKDWFYLQTLSQEIGSSNHCLAYFMTAGKIIVDSPQWKTFWIQQNNRATNLSRHTETFITT